jgi:hypothetical protein
MFCRSLFVLLTIVLSVPLGFRDSDYPFKLFYIISKQILHFTYIDNVQTYNNL